MTIEKLDASTPDLTQQNILALLELFPECRTEGSREDAPMVDFDLLRQALSDYLVEGPAERYRLDWPGKRQALLTANTPINKTLRPMREESLDFDITRNLFVEGDNLDALKLLQETYLGKVKMIYIDPPYNTGNDFIYRDNFSRSREDYEQESGQRDESGGRLVANPESNGRFHSDWLSMMLPRLKLTKNLLAEKGLLCLSLDDNEIQNARRILDEIFGESNFVACCPVINNPRGRQSDRHIAGTHEYLLIYAKNAAEAKLFGQPLSPTQRAEFNSKDDNGEPYRLLGLRQRGAASNREDRPEMYFPIYVSPDGTQISLEAQELWHEVLPRKSDGRDGRWMWGKAKCRSDLDRLEAKLISTRNEYDIFVRDFLNREDGERSRKWKSLWDKKSYNTQYGTQRVKGLLGHDIVSFPKATDFLVDIARMCLGRKDICLDFFLGSGTTADAILTLNAEDGYERKYIGVQLAETAPENDLGIENLAQIARQRIRKSGLSLLAENPTLKGKLDTGFRAFRIDSGNFVDTTVTPKEATQEALLGMVSHIKDDRIEEDLLFGALLRWGVDITLPIEQRELAGRTVWMVDAPEDGSGKGAALIGCFAKPASSGKGGIDTELADAMAALAPLRVLFRDDGFADDATKENVHSRFKQLAPDTQVRVL